MSKGLMQFNGTWKECETKGDSECLKAMGVGKTKRRIVKKLKIKLKYDVQSDSKVICTNKTFNKTEIIDLGVSKTFDSDLGTTDNLHNLEGNVLKSQVTMVKPNSSFKKMQVGDVIETTVEINDKGQLVSTVRVKGATLVKKFKLKKGGEEDNDDDDKENEKLRKLAAEAKEDDGDDDDEE